MNFLNERLCLDGFSTPNEVNILMQQFQMKEEKLDIAAFEYQLDEIQEFLTQIRQEEGTKLDQMTSNTRQSNDISFNFSDISIEIEELHKTTIHSMTSTQQLQQIKNIKQVVFLQKIFNEFIICRAVGGVAMYLEFAPAGTDNINYVYVSDTIKSIHSTAAMYNQDLYYQLADLDSQQRRRNSNTIRIISSVLEDCPLIPPAFRYALNNPYRRKLAIQILLLIQQNITEQKQVQIPVERLFDSNWNFQNSLLQVAPIKNQVIQILTSADQILQLHNKTVQFINKLLDEIGSVSHVFSFPSSQMLQQRVSDYITVLNNLKQEQLELKQVEQYCAVGGIYFSMKEDATNYQFQYPKSGEILLFIKSLNPQNPNFNAARRIAENLLLLAGDNLVFMNYVLQSIIVCIVDDMIDDIQEINLFAIIGQIGVLNKDLKEAMLATATHYLQDLSGFFDSLKQLLQGFKKLIIFLTQNVNNSFENIMANVVLFIVQKLIKRIQSCSSDEMSNTGAIYSYIKILFEQVILSLDVVYDIQIENIVMASHYGYPRYGSLTVHQNQIKMKQQNSLDIFNELVFYKQKQNYIFDDIKKQVALKSSIDMACSIDVNTAFLHALDELTQGELVWDSFGINFGSEITDFKIQEYLTNYFQDANMQINQNLRQEIESRLKVFCQLNTSSASVFEIYKKCRQMSDAKLAFSNTQTSEEMTINIDEIDDKLSLVSNKGVIDSRDFPKINEILKQLNNNKVEVKDIYQRDEFRYRFSLPNNFVFKLLPSIPSHLVDISVFNRIMTGNQRAIYKLSNLDETRMTVSQMRRDSLIGKKDISSMNIKDYQKLFYDSYTLNGYVSMDEYLIHVKPEFALTCQPWYCIDYDSLNEILNISQIQTQFNIIVKNKSKLCQIVIQKLYEEQLRQVQCLNEQNIYLKIKLNTEETSLKSLDAELERLRNSQNISMFTSCNQLFAHFQSIINQYLVVLSSNIEQQQFYDIIPNQFQLSIVEEMRNFKQQVNQRITSNFQQFIKVSQTLAQDFLQVGLQPVHVFAAVHPRYDFLSNEKFQKIIQQVLLRLGKIQKEIGFGLLGKDKEKRMQELKNMYASVGLSEDGQIIGLNQKNANLSFIHDVNLCSDVELHALNIQKQLTAQPYLPLQFLFNMIFESQMNLVRSYNNFISGIISYFGSEIQSIIIAELQQFNSLIERQFHEQLKHSKLILLAGFRQLFTLCYNYDPDLRLDKQNYSSILILKSTFQMKHSCFVEVPRRPITADFIIQLFRNYLIQISDLPRQAQIRIACEVTTDLVLLFLQHISRFQIVEYSDTYFCLNDEITYLHNQSIEILEGFKQHYLHESEQSLLNETILDLKQQWSDIKRCFSTHDQAKTKVLRILQFRLQHNIVFLDNPSLDQNYKHDEQFLKDLEKV